MKRILTIGAYERDNFGDGLYYLLARKMFAGHLVRPAAATFADMRALFGEVVLPYNHMLQAHVWDLVFVVGGELGAVDLDHALRMTLPRHQEDLFLSMSDRRSAHRLLGCARGNELAYLPNPGAFERNLNVPLCINSVGLTRLGRIGQHPLVAETMPVLRRANRISVRETDSQSYLHSVGLEASLAPDTAHTLNYYLSDEIGQRQSDLGGKYLAFQINDELLRSWTIEAVAPRIAKLAGRLSLGIKLVAAGVASYHDSYSSYLQLAGLIARSGKGPEVSIAYERTPLEIARQIKFASLWVGTSLHGRIVAIDSGVPRVGLKKDKLSAYSQQWDEQFPDDASLEDLEDAALQALSISSADMTERARWLQNLALANNQQVIQEFL